MLEYFDYKVTKEKFYESRKSDTQDMVKLIEKGFSDSQIAQMCYRGINSVWNLRKRLEKSEERRESMNRWLRQFGITEKEVEDWYKQTAKQKNKR